MLKRAGGGRGGSCALGPVPGPELLSFHLSQRVGTVRGMSPPQWHPRAVPVSLPMQLLWIFLLGLRGAMGEDLGTHTGVSVAGFGELFWVYIRAGVGGHL